MDPQLPKLLPFPPISLQVRHISLLEHKHENLPHIFLPEKKKKKKKTGNKKNGVELSYISLASSVFKMEVY
jgi:hypothetical protein